MCWSRCSVRSGYCSHGTVEAGSVRPVIERRYAFGEIEDAMRAMAGGHARGKHVVAVP